jgi:iron(III) transport system substrate-binding protein
MRLFLLFLAFFLLLACSSNPQKEVIIYVSEDQVFSEPLLKDFEKETGIKVKAVYDTEESKSTGVMNRLIAEKEHPQADLYWANEPIRAEVLRKKGILMPYLSPNAEGIDAQFKEKDNHWTGFSARIRILVVKEGEKEKPSSILDYIHPKYRAKAVIANPLFGTTTAHISALFSVWGEKRSKAFLEALKSNKVAISSSNGESADFVAKNHYIFSLVDSDDAVARLRQGEAITLVYPDQKEGELGVFVVPNAIMLIKGASHPKEAQALMDYLLSKKSEEKLAFADCAQIPLHSGVLMPKELKPLSQINVMKVDYAKVAEKMMEIQPYLKEW